MFDSEMIGEGTFQHHDLRAHDEINLRELGFHSTVSRGLLFRYRISSPVNSIAPRDEEKVYVGESLR